MLVGRYIIVLKNKGIPLCIKHLTFSIIICQNIWQYHQTWALALYFQVRSPLSPHFISMDPYRSSAHLAKLQVRSSLYCSKKNQWFALGKELLNAKSLLKLQPFALMYVCIVCVREVSRQAVGRGGTV